MLNFNNYIVRKKTYGGANGNKISIEIEHSLYMLKLPVHANKNKNISYANSSISEYIGSHIFKLLGIDAQETLLGVFTYNGEERIAVACKDFEKDGFVLKDFASLKNNVIDSSSNGYGTELVDILDAIERQNLLDKEILKKYFWDVFVIDALIGNRDRHNGNRGFLYNQENDEIKIAPIYDCGSSLFPQIDEKQIDECLKSKQSLNKRVYEVPTSAILNNGKRINYYNFIHSHEYKECDDAIKRLINKMKMNDIKTLINSIDCLNDKHKEFLIKIIELRYNKIILDNG